MSRSNFDFLAKSHPQLAQLVHRAELYCHDDPNAAVAKVRLFGEQVAQETAARLGLDPAAYNSQNQLVLALEAEGFVEGELKQVFDSVRKLGNQAIHEDNCTRGDAVHALKMAHKVL